MGTAMQTKVKISIVLATAAVGFATVMVVLAPSDQDEEKIITLGAALSASGRYKVSGNDTYNGYELAVDRINQAGGVRVDGEKYILKIETYDDKSDPARGSKIAERLIIEDGIKFMLGPYSSEMTKAVVGVTEHFKVPLVEAEGASSDLFNRGFRYIYGLLSTCENYLSDVIDLAAERAREAGGDPSDLKLAIAVQFERFSLCVRAAVVEHAEKYGMKIVVDEKLPREITTMTWFLERVRDADPDVLLISGHSMAAEVGVRQMHEMGIRVPVTAITHCEAARITEVFPAATTEGIYCPAQWAASLPYKGDLFGTAMDFSNTMKSAYPDEKYDEVPYQAASAAAAVIVWKDAFERANSFDTEKLRDALAETDLMTFYGRIKFAPTGQIISKPMILRQIRGGQYGVVD